MYSTDGRSGWQAIARKSRLSVVESSVEVETAVHFRESWTKVCEQVPKRFEINRYLGKRGNICPLSAYRDCFCRSARPAMRKRIHLRVLRRTGRGSGNRGREKKRKKEKVLLKGYTLRILGLCYEAKITFGTVGE